MKSQGKSVSKCIGETLWLSFTAVGLAGALLLTACSHGDPKQERDVRVFSSDRASVDGSDRHYYDYSSFRGPFE